MKLYFFVVNTEAGNGRAKKVWAKLKRELDQQQLNYRTFYTKSPRHAEDLTKQIVSMHGDKIQAIIAVGGDGTIHEVINGLGYKHNIRLGFIPAGSGNDFSRGFNIPKSPIQALRNISKKNPRISFIDIGNVKMEERSKEYFFVNSIGIGFDALVSKMANQSKMKKYLNKLHLGGLVYVYALIGQLFKYKKSEVELSVDGETFHYHDVWFVTVSNQSYYGGGMKIAPKANPYDGILNITVIHGVSPIKLLFLFGTVFIGKHTLIKGVQTHTGTHIKINPKAKLLLHADGEIIGTAPADVAINNRKLSLIAQVKK